MKKVFQLMCLLLAVNVVTACDDTEDNERENAVTVGTIATTDIISTSVLSGGRISGNTENVTAFGICWRTSVEPTVGDSHTEADSSPESFACYRRDLPPPPHTTSVHTLS